jgi:anthranilate/para-aminobenzoate synthase component II
MSASTGGIAMSMLVARRARRESGCLGWCIGTEVLSEIFGGNVVSKRELGACVERRVMVGWRGGLGGRELD